MRTSAGICLLWLMLVAVPTYAQDSCATAVAAPIVADGVIIEVPGDTRTLDLLPVTQCDGFSSIRQGQWFHITGAQGRLVTATTCASCFDTTLSVFSGGCSDLSCLVSNDDTPARCPEGLLCEVFSGLWSSVEFCGVEDDYWVFVTGFGGQAGTFVLTVESAGPCTPAVNDECEDALSIDSLPFATVADTKAALGGDLICNNIFESSHSTWYKVSGTGNVMNLDTCGSSTAFESSLSLFTGSCSEPVCATSSFNVNTACPNNPNGAFLSWCSVVGTDYFIMVSGVNGASGLVDLKLEEGGPCVAQANFECEDALPLSALQTGSTIGAVSAISLPECNISPIGNTGIVWFEATGNGNEILLSLCDSDYDTVIAVFSGTSCSTVNCVSFNDDGECGGNFVGTGSSLSVCTEPNLKYYVAVGGFRGAQGNYVLSATSLGPCTIVDNSVCDGARSLNVPSRTFLSTLTATPSFDVIDELIGESCFDIPTSSLSRWFSVIGTGKEMNATTCGSCMDTAIGVFTPVASPGSCSDMYCVDSNDDEVCIGDGRGYYGECADTANLWSSVTFCTSPGLTYYVVVTGYSASSGEAVLNLSETENDCVGNDECFSATPLAADDFGLTFTVDTTLATSTFENFEGENHFCENVEEVGHSVWYRLEGNGNFFTVDACFVDDPNVITAVLILSSTSGSCREADLNVCVTGAHQTCANSESFCSVVGRSYWIMVDTVDPDVSGNIDITVIEGSPCAVPINSQCIDRESLSLPLPGDGNTVVRSGSTVDQPGDVLPFSCNSLTIEPPGFSWFSVVGNGRTIEASLCGSSFDTQLGVFEGPSCDAFACVDAIDDAFQCGCFDTSEFADCSQAAVTWCSIPGVEYMLLISAFPEPNIGPGSGDFTLTLTDKGDCTDDATVCGTSRRLGFQEFNSQQIDVLSLPFQETFNSLERSSLVDLTSVPLVGCVLESEPGEQVTKSVWYTFEVETDVLIHIDTCNSDIDTILGVYTLSSMGADCTDDGLQCVAGNDDASSDECTNFYFDYGFGFYDAVQDDDDTEESALTFCASAFETYYVLVAGFENELGDIVFSFDSGELCSSNVPDVLTCEEAFEVPEMPFSAFGDTTTAMPFVSTVCYNSSVPLAGETWYSVTGTGKTIVADACAPVDGRDPFVRLAAITGGCDDDQDCVAHDVDDCSLSWCGLPGSSYSVVLMGAGDDQGPYELRFSEVFACIGEPDAPTVLVSEKSDTSLTYSWEQPFSFDFPILSYSITLLDSAGLLVEFDPEYEVECGGANLGEPRYCSFSTSVQLAPSTSYTFVITAMNEWGTGSSQTVVTTTATGNCILKSSGDLESVSVISAASGDALLLGNTITTSKDSIFHAAEMLMDIKQQTTASFALFLASREFPLLFERVSSRDISLSRTDGPQYVRISLNDWPVCANSRYLIGFVAEGIEVFQALETVSDDVCLGTIDGGLALSPTYKGLFRTEFWQQPELVVPAFSMRLETTSVDLSGQPPEPPMITEVYSTDATITVGWREGCGHGAAVTAYSIELLPATGPAIMLPPFGREHVFENLVPDTEYTFALRQLTNNGESEAHLGTISTLESYFKLDWVRQSDVAGETIGGAMLADVAVSSSGYSCVFGNFENSIRLSENIKFTAAFSVTDCFVARYDSAGQLVWATHFGQSDVGATECLSIDVNAAGDCYVTGFFQDSITFGDSGLMLTTEVTGAQNMFLSKLDESDGSAEFVKHMGDSDGFSHSGKAVAVDPVSSDVFVTGFVDGSATAVIYEDEVEVVGQGNVMAFLARWTSSGSFVGVNRIPGGEDHETQGYGLSPHSSGTLFLIGQYDGFVVTPNLVLGSFDDTLSWFVAKIDVISPTPGLAGAITWMTSISSESFDLPASVAVSPAGDYVYAVGIQSGGAVHMFSADVYDDTTLCSNGEPADQFEIDVEDGQSYEYSSSYFDDFFYGFFCEEYEPNGSVSEILAADDGASGPLLVALSGSAGDFEWLDTVSSSANSGIVTDVEVLATGDVIVSGVYFNAAPYTDDSFAGQELIYSTQATGYLLAYRGDSPGLVWTRWLGTPNSQQVVTGIDVSSSNAILVAGLFRKAASLDCEVTITGSVDFAEVFFAQLADGLPSVQATASSADICGELLLTEHIGSIDFPVGSADSYPNGVDCFWLIEPLDVYHILLTVENFDLLGIGDYLVFYDGSTTSSDALIRYDGNNARVSQNDLEYYNNYDLSDDLQVHSTGETVLIHFHSDQCLRGVGFELDWASSLKVAHCDPDFPVLTVLQEGFISESPAGGYRDSTDCSFLIEPSFDIDFIVAEFVEFRVAADDCVTFYDGPVIDDSIILDRFCGDDLVYPIQSTGRSLLVRFEANESNYAEGWVIAYRGSLEQEYCFGTEEIAVADEPVSFRSHLAADTFQPVADCGWEVTADESRFDSVYAHFTEFDVPDAASVVVSMERLVTSSIGAVSVEGEVVEVSSATALSSLYISETPFMRFDFEANGASGDGFEANVCAHPIGGACQDEVLTDLTGFFDNHFCFGFYESNADCSWTIAPAEPSIDYIMLAFSSVDMRQDPSQDGVTDYIEVRGHSGTQLAQIARQQEFYETNDLPVFVTEESSLEVRFVSDALISGEGFDAEYCVEYPGRSIPDGGCSADAILNLPQGSFDNKFCGGFHGANMSCSWSVDAKASGSTAMLIIRDLFFADEPFGLQVSSANLLSRSADQSIIESAVAVGGWEDNLRIFVDDELFRIYNRGGEFDDKTPPADQENGTEFELPIVISFVLTDIRAEFESNDSGFARGFDATYCVFGEVDTRVCSGDKLFERSEGSFNSRACDNFYQADADCTFTVQPTAFVEGEDAIVLYLTVLDFNNANVNDPKDKLTVYNGALQAPEFIEETYDRDAAYYEEFEPEFPKIHVSIKPTMSLHLETDSVLYAEGFAVEYCTAVRPVSTCGGAQVVTGMSGIVRDRECGPTYTAPKECSWIIDPSQTVGGSTPYDFLVIIFNEVDIGDDAFVQVFSPNSILLASSDENQLPSDELPIIAGSAVFVDGMSAEIAFDVSESAPLRSGWELSFMATNETGVCTEMQTYTAVNGTIRDHEFGNFYANNAECQFLIQVSGASTISVQFTKFALERGFDFVEVYDGSDFQANLIGFFTGDDVPAAFSSTGDSLFFIFSSDESVVDGGFEFFYSDSALLSCPLFCSGFGDCVDNACQCDEGRFGDGCEIPPSPVLQSANFASGLQHLDLIFNLPSNKASMNEATYGLQLDTDCSFILDEATLQLIGTLDVAQCVWRTPEHLLVKFGNGPSITVGDSVGIIGGVLTHPGLAEPTTPAMSIILGGPTVQSFPQAVLVAPSSVAAGESLLLDARSSFMDGGRALTYSWSAELCVDTGGSFKKVWGQHTGRSLICSPATSILDSVLSAADGSTVPLSASELMGIPIGEILQVTVTATDFLGSTSEPTVANILYTSEQQPQVYILGRRTRSIDRNEPLNLRGKVILPLVVQARAVEEDVVCHDITFQWSIEQCTVPPCPSLDSRTRNALDLFVPSMSLDYGNDYTFRLDVTFNAEPGTPTSTSFVDIFVNDIELDVAIAGGDRVLSRQNDINLSAVLREPLAGDLPNNGESIAYRWNCRKQSGHSCQKTGGELLVLQSTSDFTIAGDSLLPGDYFFSVLAKENVTDVFGQLRELSSFDRVSIRILRRGQTDVRINVASGSVRHNPSEPLALEAIVGTGGVAVPDSAIRFRSWSIPAGDFSLVPGSTTLSEDTTSSSLVISPRVMHGGAIYRFRLEAEQFGLNTGEAELDIEINSPPSGGRVVVSPESGLSTSTVFFFEASGASDEEIDMPLSYVFGIKPTTCSEEEKLERRDTPDTTADCPEIPLSNLLDVSTFEAFLPAGDFRPFVDIYDRQGATARFYGSDVITVTDTCPETQDELALIMSQVNARANTALCIGDFDQVRQFVNLATSLMLCVDFEISDASEKLYTDVMLPLLAEAEESTAVTAIYLDNRVKTLLAESDLMLNRFVSNSSTVSFVSLMEDAATESITLGFAREDSASALLKAASRALESDLPAEASAAFSASLQGLAKGALQNRFCDNIQTTLAEGTLKINARRRSSANLNSATLTTPMISPFDASSSFSLPSDIADILGADDCVDYTTTQFVANPYHPETDVEFALLTRPADLTFSSSAGVEVPVSGLSTPISITVPKIPGAEETTNAALTVKNCAFWSESLLDWVREGCTIVGEDEEFFYLEATHLTSFSVLFDGGGGGSAAPPITISSFGSFADDFTGASDVFDASELDENGELVSSFTRFSVIPDEAFDSSDTVAQLLDQIGEVESTDPWTWDVIASMSFGAAAVVCVILVAAVLSIPPIRHTLDGSRSREHLSRVIMSSQKERELSLLRSQSPTTASSGGGSIAASNYDDYFAEEDGM